MRSILLTLMLGAAACEITYIDGEDDGDESTSDTNGPGHTSTTTGTTTTSSTDGYTSTTGSGSTGEPETTDDASTSGSVDDDTGSSSTGDVPPGSCEDGTILMLEDRCTCVLDGGATRAIDPAECGCTLADSTCDCGGQIFPSVSCAWPCGSEPVGCLCAGEAAPAEWCESPIPCVIQGDQCFCGDELIDPSACGPCGLVDGVCLCVGELAPESFCL